MDLKNKSWAELASWIYKGRLDSIGSCYDFYEVSSDGRAIKAMKRYILSWQQIGANHLVFIRKKRSGDMLSLLLLPEMTLEDLEKEIFYFFYHLNCSALLYVNADSHRKVFPLIDSSCVRDDSENNLCEITSYNFVKYAAENVFEGSIDFRNQLGDWYRLMAIAIPNVYNWRNTTHAKLVFCARWDGKMKLFSCDTTDEKKAESLSKELHSFLFSQQSAGKISVGPALGKKIRHGGTEPETIDHLAFIQWLASQEEISDQALVLIDNILRHAAGLNRDQ